MAIPENIRKALLGGGVNYVWDFYDTANYNPNGIDSELPAIVAAGAKHVRLPLSMDILEDKQTGKVRADRYPDLVAFIRKLQAAGLVTIVDMHNTGQFDAGTTNWTNNYMGGLVRPAVRARHLSLLTDLAKRLQADADPEWVVLCPANEPIFDGAGMGAKSVWYNHQTALIPAMRAVAPDLVLVTMANDWQSMSATINDLTLFDDPLTIVDCHMYDPKGVTHPKDAVAADVTYPGVYGDSWYEPVLWNKAKLESWFAEFIAWSRKHAGVFIHFSEIGTKCTVPEAARAAYLADVTGILRANGFGFTVYDWKTSKPHNFGIKMHPKVIDAVFGKAPVIDPPPPVVTPPTYDEAALKALVDAAVKAQTAALELKIAALEQQVSEFGVIVDTAKKLAALLAA